MLPGRPRAPDRPHTQWHHQHRHNVHGERGREIGTPLLAAVVLGAFALIGAFSIGLFSVPAAADGDSARWPKSTTGAGGSRP